MSETAVSSVSYVDPDPPQEGALFVFTDSAGWDRCKELEDAKTKRIYRARGSFADHVPLAMPFEKLLAAFSVEHVVLRHTPTTLKLDQGGDPALATPFTLVGDSNLKLLYGEVFVESDSPRRALFHARTAFNRLADGLCTVWHVPLVLVRTDLFLEHGDTVLSTELVMPYRTILDVDTERVMSIALFAAPDSLLREAITANSPYYRFLCAFKLHEAVELSRASVRRLCKKYHVVDPMPRPVPVSDAHFEFIGGFLEGVKLANRVKTSKDLFGMFRKMRNRIAHFLLTPNREVVPLWEGRQYRAYSISSALLLHLADVDLKALRAFYCEHLLEQHRAAHLVRELR